MQMYFYLTVVYNLVSFHKTPKLLSREKKNSKEELRYYLILGMPTYLILRISLSANHNKYKAKRTSDVFPLFFPVSQIIS